MANANRPRGFWPAYTLHGGPPHMRRVPKGDDIIYKGDLLKTGSSLAGSVSPISAATDIIIGVAAEFTTVAGTNAAPVYVNMYDDLTNTIFAGQCDTTGICGTTDTMVKYAAVVTAATTTAANETSVMQIDADTTDDDGALYAIGLVDRVDNVYGEFAEIYCKILTLDGTLYAAVS